MKKLIDWISKITPQGYLRFLGWVNATLPAPILFWLIVFDKSLFGGKRDFEAALFSCGILFALGMGFFIWAAIVGHSGKSQVGSD